MTPHLKQCCEVARFSYSTILLIFSVVIVMALIAMRDTRLSQDVHPAFAYVVIWSMVLWLSVVEGGQASLVGLHPIRFERYKDSHPLTFRVTSLAYKGDNLDRYLIGRQFLVVLVVFLTNLSGAPTTNDTILGMPDVLKDVFLSSGVAMILMVAMIGQLASQVNASHCMLDFINTHAMVFTLYVALAIEFSGLLHFCYVVQWAVAKLAGKSIKSKEGPRSSFQQAFFLARIAMSTGTLVFAFAVTLSALFAGQTTMWEGVPAIVAVILFFLLMSIVGMLEGAQIAFFAVAKLSKEDRPTHPVAVKTCELLFKGEGRNLPAFMIGRQIAVTMCFFIIARVTTLNVDLDAGDKTVFGASDGVQHFFNMGLLGAIITTVVGSISWQLVASAFPSAFLSNPLVYLLLRICLVLEFTGICSGAWVLASVHKRLAAFQRDEKYLGTDQKDVVQQEFNKAEIGSVGPEDQNLPNPATLGNMA